MNDNNPFRKPVTLELWHIVLILMIQGLAFAVAWGKSEEALEDMSRRIALIESNRTITRDEFDSYKEDLRGRLDNIESELARIRLGGQ